MTASVPGSWQNLGNAGLFLPDKRNSNNKASLNQRLTSIPFFHILVCTRHNILKIGKDGTLYFVLKKRLRKAGIFMEQKRFCGTRAFPKYPDGMRGCW